MDFVILKVNGQDVSNSSHEDAVRCFQLAQEPIIVEVLRRQPPPQQPQQAGEAHDRPDRQDRRDKGEPETEESSEKNSANREPTIDSIDRRPSLVSIAVQTEWAGLLEEEEEEEEEEDEDYLPPISPNVGDGISDGLEELLSQAVVFEEVTLRKTGSAEKLGLTVCYSSGSGSEDADTEVYISEIVPESLAARNGRLREGDQILWVNGKEVANKEQTENLFAETKNSVTIFVSRCLYQEDEDEGEGEGGDEDEDEGGDEDEDEERPAAYRQGSPLFSPENVPAYQNSMIEQLIRQQQQSQPQPQPQPQQQQTEERTKEAEGGASSSLKAPPPVPSHSPQQQPHHHQYHHHHHHHQHQQQQQQLQSSGSVFSTTTSSSTCSSQNSQKSGKNASSPARHAEDRKQWSQEASKDCSKKIENLSLRIHQTSPGVPSAKPIDAYLSRVWSETEHIYETIPESDSEPIYSSPYEHHRWTTANHETTMSTTTMTMTMTTSTATTTIQHPHGYAGQTKWHSSSKSNSSGEEKDSSSAYNTGESCNSNPLTLELHQGERDRHRSTLVLCPPKVSSTLTPSQQHYHHYHNHGSAHNHNHGHNCNHHYHHHSQQQQQQQQHQHQHQQQQQQQQQQEQQKIGCGISPSTSTVKQSKSQMSGRRNSSSSHRPRDHGDPTNAGTLPADTMYTNVANLQRTMRLQQQLFKQALDRRNYTGRTGEPGVARKSKSHGNFQAPNLTQYQFVGSRQVCGSTSWIPPEEKSGEVQMEWKVKRRADGSRYIARRPVRNCILRNRAIKISEERAGHTTEDDTMSEMKIGRYWTKEERKRQLERARERKQREQESSLLQQQQQPQQQQQQPQQQQPQSQPQQQQQQLQQNNDSLCEHVEDKAPKKPLNIVELSHKKMARKKNVLDDFTTVQEMLVHGNRVGTGGPGSGGKLMGLLSVTTV